jgi:hypothetical protein
MSDTRDNILNNLRALGPTEDAEAEESRALLALALRKASAALTLATLAEEEARLLRERAERLERLVAAGGGR